jgi:hypothetical protein
MHEMPLASAFPGALLSLLVCTAVGLTSCGPFFHREVAGLVLSLEGTSQATASGQTRPLTSGYFIHPGETIATTHNGRLDLMLLPGVLLELEADTQLEIVQLHLVRDGDETIQPMKTREGRIALHRGSLIASVGPAQTESSLEIATAPALVTAGPDRTFKIEAGNTGVRVLCIRGEITTRSTAGRSNLNVPAGYFACLPSDFGKTPRRAATANARVQAEVPIVLRIEKRLLLLQNAEGSAFRPWR